MLAASTVSIQEATTMAALTAAQQQFLDNPYVGVVTTLRADGSPHSTIVWVEQTDGEVSFNTATGRAKERELASDPRVSLLVVDPQNAYQWVSLSGTAEVTRDDADAQIDRLAKKYLGQDEYPWRKPEEERLKVRIRADKIDSAGFDA
jgi:PPOX class probable F420-dependent enzyme